MNLEELGDKLVSFLHPGVLGALGGAAKYLQATVLQEKNFIWKMFLANLFLAAFAAVLVGQFIDSDYKYRTGIMMLSGLAALPILVFAELQAKSLVNRLIKPHT